MNINYSENKVKNYTKIFLVSFVFIFSFFFYEKGFAYTITSNLNDNNSENISGAIVQSIGSNLSGTVNSVDVNVKGNINNQSFTFQFGECNNSSTCFSGGGLAHQYTATLSDFATAATSAITNGIQSIVTSPIFNYWKDEITLATGTGGILLNSSKYYQFRLQSIPSTSTITWYGSNNASSYLNGSCGSGCSTLQDIYFVLNGTGTIPTSINFSYPNNGITTNDFENWVIQGTGSFNQIGIRYKLSSSTGGYNYADIHNPYSTLNGAIIQIPKSQPLFQFPLNATNSWTAQLFYYDSNNTYNISDTITFTIGLTSTSTATTSAGWLAGIMNPITNFFYTDSSSTDPNCNLFALRGCFVNVITEIINIAFMPEQNIVDAVSKELTNFQSVFPFSIPMTLMNSLQEDVSSTPANLSLQLPMPWATSTGPIILSSSTLNNTVGSTTKNSYFTAVNIILYLITGLLMISAISV